MLQKIDIVLSAVQKYDPVFQQFIKRRKILAEQRTASLGDDIFLDIHKHLGDLLPDPADHPPPGRLQLRQPRLDNVRLLAALEVLAALPNPFLPFQNEISELIGEFLSKKLQKAETEYQIDLDVLVIFRLCEGALKKFAD